MSKVPIRIDIGYKCVNQLIAINID